MSQCEVSEGGMEGDGGRTVDVASYLHCIATDRTEHSSSRSGPSRCTWCTSRPDLDAAPGRPLLFSSPPFLYLCVGRDKLKRPENSLHEIDPGRAIAEPHVYICVWDVPELLSVSCSKIDFDWFSGSHRTFGDNIRRKNLNDSN